MRMAWWHRLHKWFGLAAFFTFSLSGLMLNHLSLFKDMNVSCQSESLARLPMSL